MSHKIQSGKKTRQAKQGKHEEMDKKNDLDDPKLLLPCRCLETDLRHWFKYKGTGFFHS